jgi:hypothetical protein
VGDFDDVPAFMGHADPVLVHCDELALMAASAGYRRLGLDRYFRSDVPAVLVEGAQPAFGPGTRYLQLVAAAWCQVGPLVEQRGNDAGGQRGERVQVDAAGAVNQDADHVTPDLDIPQLKAGGRQLRLYQRTNRFCRYQDHHLLLLPSLSYTYLALI